MTAGRRFDRPRLDRPRFDRLVSTGNVVTDLVVTVPGLPQRGGDVLATSCAQLTGGGFNVLAAASRLGLESVYAGVLGTGPRADQARRDLQRERVRAIGPVRHDADLGLVISLVDRSGERTFVTVPGAEATLSVADLDGLEVAARDIVLVSGYSLVHRANRAALDSWLARLATDVFVAVDPGPLVAEIADDVRRRTLARARLLTCNAAEAAALTGRDDAAAAVQRLRALAPQADLVLRRGAIGAVVAEPGGRPVTVAGLPVAAIDTTGAGDAHTGALLAGLAAGMNLSDAAGVANAAAAFAVTRRGPATGPTARELAAFRGQSH